MAKQETENDLCRCCHSEGSYKHLYATYFWLEEEEVVFFNMLQECFDIEMTPVNESLQHMLCSICNTCIERLQDAVKFKRQIQKCERRFREVYGSCVGEPEPTFEVKIKEEIDVDTEELKALPGDQDKDQTLERPTSSKMAMEFDKLINDDDDRGWSESDDEDLFAKSSGKKPAADNSRKGVKRKASQTDSTTEDNQPSGDQDLDSEKNDQIEVIDGVSYIPPKNVAVLKKNIHFMETERGMQCLKCSTVAKTYIGIKKHLRHEHFQNSGKYKCTNCIQVFWELPALVVHKFETHNVDDRFKCKACSIVFKSSLVLKQHIDSFHMLGKKFKCNECDYETFFVRYLKRHEKSHSKEKKFQCQYCRKAFKRRCTLLTHEKIHTRDKKKACSACGQAFVQRASLKYHMLKHHPGVDF